MGKMIDLTGQRFGSLTVVRFSHKNSFQQAVWLCECDCGKETSVHSNNLRRGYTRSCGCVRNSKTSERAKKHGMHGSNLYERWKSMKERCEDLNNPNYGGKGIKVCDEWKDNFQAFAEWAMANGYDPKLQIDRMDGTGNYEPSNCRWVTAKVNSENRKDVKKVKVTSENGIEIFNSASEAAKAYGVSRSVVHRALKGVHVREQRYCFEYL